MNPQKFFEIAKAKGLSESQLMVSKSTSTNFSLFRHEVDEYEISDTTRVIAVGVYNGKMGVARSEELSLSSFEYLVDQIILGASKVEKEEIADLFEGSEKYHKRNVYNKKLAEIPVSEKMATLRALENKIYAVDERVAEVEAYYAERERSVYFGNSHGLKLNEKSNYFVIGASVVTKQGEETKTNYDGIVDADFSVVDVDKFSRHLVEEAVKKFGGETIESKKYPTVLSKEVASSFVGALLASAIAESVQRHSSFLEGKLNTKIASSKLTIEEKPLAKNIFFTYFDDEGVATQNKTVIKKGVLNTYFYNRETAKKDGVETTGNAALTGNKMGTSFGNVFVKPGRHSFEEMIAPIEEGVYITEVMGLGTGLNGSSGDFSCQAEGYMIRKGKVAEPITLITLSGNVLKMFKDLKDIDNETKLLPGGTTISNMYFKSLNIGGK